MKEGSEIAIVFFFLWCSIGTYFVLIVFVLTFTVSVSCPLLSLGPFPLILPLCFLLIISRGPTRDPLHLSSGHNFLYDKTVIRRTSSSRVRRDFVGEAEDRRSPSIPENQERDTSGSGAGGSLLSRRHLVGGSGEGILSEEWFKSGVYGSLG